MLEVEIQSLKAEINALKDAITSLTTTLIGQGQGQAHATLTVAPAVITPAPTAEAADVPFEVEATPEQITAENLQAICLAIVRKTPAMKQRVKDTIAAFDGAATIAKVPVERYSELKAALEALQ